MTSLGFGKKLYLGSFGIIILTIVIIGVVNFFQSSTAFLAKGKTGIENVAGAMLKTMELKYNMQKDKIEADLGLLESKKGEDNQIMVVAGRTVEMALTDRATGKKLKQTLPKLIFGLEFVTGEYEIVDSVGKITDSEIAVYQFFEDKLIKVSTSWKNTDESRPVGEYFSSNTDIYTDLMADKIHIALVENHGRRCMQIFKPFREAIDNKIVGAYSISSQIITPDIAGFIQSLHVSGKGVSFIASPEGRILVHPDKTVIDQSVREFSNGEAILKTDKGFVEYTDGVDKYYSYIHQFTPWNLIFGVAVSENELMAGMNEQILTSSAISGLIALVVGALIIGVMNRQLMTSMAGMATLAREVAKGNFRHSFSYTAADAIKETVDSMNEMVQGLGNMIIELNRGVDTLSTSSGELNTIADQMSRGSGTTLEKLNAVSAAAEEMSVNMDSVAAAMEQASTNVETVALGTSDMSSNIEKVAQNSKNTREVTGKAVEQAEKTTSRIRQLGKAAEEINKVTDTINNISSQTNLLALNATIEAARAGEAGKGFAVVANEIKELAKQTAGATEDIAQNIHAIQDEISGAVKEIKEISGIISQIDEFVTEASSAIDSQSATTGEIAENINQVSLGIQEVNENVNQSSAVSGKVAEDISEILAASQQINNLSADVKKKADTLTGVMEQLKTLTGRFQI